MWLKLRRLITRNGWVLLVILVSVTAVLTRSGAAVGIVSVLALSLVLWASADPIDAPQERWKLKVAERFRPLPMCRGRFYGAIGMVLAGFGILAASTWIMAANETAGAFARYVGTASLIGGMLVALMYWQCTIANNPSATRPSPYQPPNKRLKSDARNSRAP